MRVAGDLAGPAGRRSRPEPDAAIGRRVGQREGADNPSRCDLAIVAGHQGAADVGAAEAREVQVEPADRAGDVRSDGVAAEAGADVEAGPLGSATRAAGADADATVPKLPNW